MGGEVSIGHRPFGDNPIIALWAVRAVMNPMKYYNGLGDCRSGYGMSGLKPVADRIDGQESRFTGLQRLNADV